jgi:hypothetical protein
MPEPYRSIYTVPSPSDAPDVPLAFKQFANNQWHNNDWRNAQDYTTRVVYQDEGGHFGPGVELLGIDLPATWPQFTLMFISTQIIAGTFGNEVIGYQWVEGDGGILTQQGIVSGQPSATTYTHSFMRVKQTPPGGRISLKVRMDTSNCAFYGRTMSIYVLGRG